MSATYSVSHYNEYQQTKNKNLFEEIVDQMMLDGINPALHEKIKNLPLEDKRMAILAFLDQDRNLFMKIKSLISRENLSKMDYVKDVVRMLREYVKVGEVEKKKFGEVMTSLDLVKEMIKTLPEEVWSNPDLKWIDPANGTGPFPIMVIYRLMVGLEKWQPDPNLRYKHIVENMIYTCELQAKNVFLWLCAVDPHDEYETNTYWGSFLDEGFDKHMKDVWGLDSLESFNVILGNPPYNMGNRKNFYIDFFERSLKLVKKDGFITFITPSRYVIQPEFLEFRKRIEEISKSVYIKNTGRIFGENASFSTVYTTIYMGDGCDVDWISGFDDSVVRKVLNKSHKNYLETKRSKSLLRNKEERDSYDDVPLANHDKFFVNSKGNCETPFRYLPFDKKETFIPKVFMTEFVGTGESKTLGKIYTDYYGEIGLATDSCMYIHTDDIERQDSLKTYLSSKLIRYILNKVCQSSHANQTMRLIPDPTIEKVISSDKDLYEYFNLTEEEINLIENSVK